MRFVFTLLMFVLTCQPLHARNLVLAPLPMESRETVLKQFMPMARYLQQSLGHEVVFDYSDSYEQILEKFTQGRIDLAYLGPLPYVSLKKVCPDATPLVHFREASGDPLYTCAIVAPADKRLVLEGLEHRKVALTQPLSTCGFLATNGLLRERGSALSRNLYRYLDKHDEVAKAVVRGEFDLGGIKTAIGRKYAHLGLTIMAESAPMPSFALVGNAATLSPAEREAIRQALASLDPDGKDKAMLSSWGENLRYGSVPADDGDYAPVRALLGNDAIPEDGNF
ncbi:PhnD/SsuA/transferrin family substrate-binding protein [Desulfomicrobium escambiense]|uniref:PhnD/SsuA/transferrin family substrate-binding protein n=1 Tax=Desulfomicrobium escambiense TaxID=29503 RepID=UPI0004273CDE|nr:PhnD/SsuA/transferrin family substrate-binding protein [Desulfomicrobium escambiense]